MSLNPPAKHARLARRNLAFGLAVVLPVSASIITAHVHYLQRFPFALSILSVALIATLGGLGPSLLGVLLAVAARDYFLHFGPFKGAFTPSELVRIAILFSVSLIISLISRSVRRSEERLEVAVSALQERTDDLVASLASSKCACWTLNLDGRGVATWYSDSYPVYGRPFAELDLETLVSLVEPEDRARLPGAATQMRTTTDPILFEHRVRWPNGEVHTLEMRGNRVPGEQCIWRGVTLDVTERKQTEAALLRAEKLAAMGRLASTVAHEINNPLEAVTNLLYLARTDDRIAPDTQTYLELAERELGRLSNITRLTLGFVRTSGNIVETEMSTIVEDVLSIFRHRLETRQITIERHFEPEIRILIVPHELRQIVTNLIANAADAVADETGCIVVHIRREAASAVLLIDDNGSGIAPEHIHRIFDPFFSTKAEVGTGIGLWTTKELTEKNGGRLSVQTGVPDGSLPEGVHTRFRIEFPVAA